MTRRRWRCTPTCAAAMTHPSLSCRGRRPSSLRRSSGGLRCGRRPRPASHPMCSWLLAGTAPAAAWQGELKPASLRRLGRAGVGLPVGTLAWLLVQLPVTQALTRTSQHPGESVSRAHVLKPHRQGASARLLPLHCGQSARHHSAARSELPGAGPRLQRMRLPLSDLPLHPSSIAARAAMQAAPHPRQLSPHRPSQRATTQT